MQIHKLAVGGIKTYHWNNKMECSAIGKHEVEEVFLSFDGFEGDSVANPSFHGGPERAVCLYPLEHYQLWESEFSVSIPKPGFGENISIQGMKEDQVFIGDTFQIGNAVIQVSQGRIPCSTISKFNQIDGLLKRVVQTGFTGYFFRVIQEGVIKHDSKLTLVHRNEHSVSVLHANQIYFHDRSNKKAIDKILLVDELAVAWREILSELLTK